MNSTTIKMIEVIDYLVNEKKKFKSRRQFCLQNGMYESRLASIENDKGNFNFDDVITLKNIYPELNLNWLFGFSENMAETIIEGSALEVYLQKLVKEQQETISSLTKSNGRLEMENESLKKRVSALENTASCADVG